MSNVSAPIKETRVFPHHELRLLLADELSLAAETEASMLGIPMPTQHAQFLTTPVPIDSLVAVGILCSAEPLLGFAPPDATVQTGGYTSVEDALDHLLPRLERLWQKKMGSAK